MKHYNRNFHNGSSKKYNPASCLELHLQNFFPKYRRALPDLTDLVEFLERIQHFPPFIQQIAIPLYGWATGIDRRHLHRLADICFELAGGGAYE